MGTITTTVTLNFKLADKVGYYGALIAQEIAYWGYRNELNTLDEVYIHGYYWFRSSYDKFSERLLASPTHTQIKYAIKKLSENGFIEILGDVKNSKFNFNYYRITNKLIEFVGPDGYNNMIKCNNENYNENYNKDSKDNKNSKKSNSTKLQAGVTEDNLPPTE